MESYPYNFNGKELDSETSTQDYGMRIYNPNLGKFFTEDPLTLKYPELSPYQFASNNPILAVDLDGLEAALPQTGLNQKSQPIITKQHVDNLQNAHNYLVLFRAAGRPLSEYALTRYLEGKGGYDVFSYKTFENASYKVGKMNNQLKDASISKLNDQIDAGKTGNLQTDASQAHQQAGAFLSDFGTSIGSFDILTKGQFNVTTDEQGNTNVIGIIYFTLRDEYQWKEGRGKDMIGGVNHNDMNTLKDLGAKEFKIRSYYKQIVTGTNGNYQSGPLMDSSKEEYGKHAEHPGDDYSLPDHAKETNNYAQPKQ